MLFKKLKVDQLLDETEEESTGNNSTAYIAIFFISIVAAVCMVFIRVEYFLLTLFAPAILIMVIRPPFQTKKGLFRVVSLLYLLFLLFITIIWASK